ncbi:MAG: DUF1269 domain-containing protein [Gammaproteobacteria bacterium]
MTRRLYFLVPDAATCKAIVEELRDIGIKESHTHVIASHTAPIEGLHEASILQTTEFKHGLEEGLGLGGVAGLLGGLLAVTFPPAGLVLGGGALVASTLAGAGLGALVSALISKDIPNRQLAAFQGAIAAGQLLFMVDVPRQRVDEVTALIQSHHPEAEIEFTHPSSAKPSGPLLPASDDNRHTDSS